MCEHLGTPKGLDFVDDHAYGKSDSTIEINYGKEELSLNISKTKTDMNEINVISNKINSPAISTESALTSSLSRDHCERKHENRYGVNHVRVPEEEYARFMEHDKTLLNMKKYH